MGQQALLGMTQGGMFCDPFGIIWKDKSHKVRIPRATGVR